MYKILFICMGNICRSPSAEGFFARALQQSVCKDMVTIDSAGTHSYHIGHAPDPRAVETALKFGVNISHLRARKVIASDFHDFDLMVAMDHDNLADLHAIRPPDSKARMELMMNFHPEGQPEEVPDPYYGGMDGFDYMCELLDSASAGLLKDIEKRLGS
jgi:protein-tyrosine phosphatase